MENKERMTFKQSLEKNVEQISDKIRQIDEKQVADEIESSVDLEAAKQELKQKRTNLEKMIEQIPEVADDSWADFKSQAEETWNDIVEGFKKINIKIEIDE